MLEIFAIVAAVIAAAVVAIIAVAARRPDTFSIERSTVIAASPGPIFAVINDFRQWPSWSPWQKLDPDMKVTVSDPPSGPGAVSTWDGNKKVGAGRTTILEVDTPRRLVMRLEMFRPFPADNTVEYTLTPRGDGTAVVWAMRGSQPLMAKIFGLFVDCDRMVGKDFELGLANLRSLIQR